MALNPISLTNADCVHHAFEEIGLIKKSFTFRKINFPKIIFFSELRQAPPLVAIFKPCKMRRLILILTFSSLLSCKNSKEKAELAKANNINEIVETVITEDSLNVLKTKTNSKRLNEDLTVIDIYTPVKDKYGFIHTSPIHRSAWEVSIEDILRYKNIGLFSSKDSLYLLKQNSNPQKFKIDETILQKVNQTTWKKEFDLGTKHDYYEMTIPLFSLDNKNAYLELIHLYGQMQGTGKAIYLKKINGRWKIIKKKAKWIS